MDLSKKKAIFQARLVRQEQLRLRSLPKTKKWRTLRQIVVESVQTGNQRGVSSAISHGAEVRLWLTTPTEYARPCTLLGMAADHGHHQLIDCLLEAGIDIDDPGLSPQTPLHAAVNRNNIEFTRKLIQAGPDIEATNSDEGDTTALHLAAALGHTECMRLLMSLGQANIEALDGAPIGQTPLHYAAARNQLAAMKLLLTCGCNINACDIAGTTALHIAAEEGNKKTAELLVKRGCDLLATDMMGRTAMAYADGAGHESLVTWFAKLNDNNTPISASSNGPYMNLI